eukprot:5549827-Alexandrium_andersonii.AAC.1
MLWGVSKDYERSVGARATWPWGEGLRGRNPGAHRAERPFRKTRRSPVRTLRGAAYGPPQWPGHGRSNLSD